ncbi:hypothetical protein L228DRAFT_44582 [Xylona heveae TC161]|uniref:Vegetative cell wall protein gp1 n=1 Tax=Xylona heveae (strain CBS 132557 / TC161) TaxID=1328760 RepID=A0A164ZTM6_XYLHT|nr:hypothetical protein L228DRAFT_44582 [Xylona heveae TC161]KZF19497.1 hypothetical protein L228DRAFT_44582 [Xylona heveae TC161]
MFAPFTAPPPTYAFDYTSPPVSPAQAYYSPRYSIHTATPSPCGSPKSAHGRRATYGQTPFAYTSPRMPSGWPPYQSTNYYSTGYTGSSQRNPDYIPIYTEAAAAADTPRRSRASTHHHRASYSTHHATPQKPAKHSTPKSPSPKATEEDARRAGIPAGYSYKNWDPTEEPIMLLGSVFDANSLGKWIYDWTVFHHGPATPIAEIAGELWLLLIQLAGKMKRGEDCLSRIRSIENRELVEDFLESGERLWARFRKLLKACEEYMWKAARKEGGKEKKVSMGKDSGCEFVDAIFGRDRELDLTEKIMQGMRYWKVRFDANCEDILRHPSA